MRTLASLVLLTTITASTLRAADLPPLGDQAGAWAKAQGNGAVATAEKRDGKWAFAIGGQPFAEGHAPVPPEKVLFEIGSISKVFTGLLLADAVVEGKLKLDDTLATRLPVKFADAAVGALTLEQLATHSSCLPRLPGNMMNADGADPYAAYDERAMFEFLATAKLDGTPPCKAEYSNFGFGVLGVVLEKAYGKSWESLVTEKITGPLGMGDTVQHLSEDQQSRFALPWDGTEAAHRWTFQAIAGAGALCSTLADLSRLADALAAGEKGPLGAAWPVLAGDYVDFPAMGGKLGLALMHARISGADTYTHDGGTGGYRSGISVSPEQGTATVLLASNAKAMPPAWLASWRATGAEPVKREAITMSTEALDEYAGVYPLDKQGRITVLRNGDGLVVRITGQGFAPIYPSAKDEFFYKIVDAQISFARDAGGKVASLTLHQNGHDMPAPRDAGPPHVEFPSDASLAEYVGSYDFGAFMPGATIEIKAAPGALAAQLTGQPALLIFCTAKDRFEYDVVDAAITFDRDEKAAIAAAVLHQNGMDMRAPRK
jgi:CubicO group peptidase (beta-lactamase class C family)